MRFPISYSRPMAVLATVLGIGPGRGYVEVDDLEVVVRMGWAFSARIPRAAIGSAGWSSGRFWYGVGVHLVGRGDWIVNGTTNRLVELRIAPPVPVRAVGLPVTLRRLRVSVEQPEALVAALQPA